MSTFMQERAEIWRQIQELNIVTGLNYREIKRDDFFLLRRQIEQVRQEERDVEERRQHRRAINQAILDRARNIEAQRAAREEEQRELERAREEHRQRVAAINQEIRPNNQI